MLNLPLRRVIASLLVVCLAADAGRAFAPGLLSAPNRRCSSDARATFEKEALAPVAAGVIECLDGSKAQLVHRYEQLPAAISNEKRAGLSRIFSGRSAGQLALPRHAGAGETSIHKAIQHAQRLAAEGKTREVMSFLPSLFIGLRQAQKSGHIDALMDTWNARYPSELPVDILIDDIPRFLTAIEEIVQSLDSPEERREGEAFLEMLRLSLAMAIREAMMAADYTSLKAMLDDQIDTEGMVTTFDVSVAASLRDSVAGMATVTLRVQGYSSIGNVIDELETQFPDLAKREWRLLVDGADYESVLQLILPGQALELISPEDPPKSGGSGLGFGPLLSGLLWTFTFALHPAFSPSLIGELARLAISIWVFWADKLPSSTRAMQTVHRLQHAA